MIQPLRKIHRGMFFALLLVLPVLFASGLLLRSKPLPSGHSQNTGVLKPRRIVSERTAVFSGKKFAVRVVEEDSTASGQQKWALELIPESPLLTPDVLVYWSKTDATHDLPVTATLLGALQPGGGYRLPTQANDEQSFVILYSLAWKQTLGSSAIGPSGSQR